MRRSTCLPSRLPEDALPLLPSLSVAFYVLPTRDLRDERDAAPETAQQKTQSYLYVLAKQNMLIKTSE